MTDADQTSEERRKGGRDRRVNRKPTGPLDDRRTRFSLSYFVIAFLVLFGIQFVVGHRGAEPLSYSALKERISDGQVATVRLSVDGIEAVPIDSIRDADAV